MKRRSAPRDQDHGYGLVDAHRDGQGAGRGKRRGKGRNRRPRPDPSWGSRLDLADLSETDDGTGSSGYAWAGLDGPTPKAKDQRGARAGLRPGARGWMGRGRGQALVVQTAPEFRATTSQVCGLWPWAVGAGAPVVGVPLGHHLGTGATVCADPISWFQLSHLIANPSVFVLGLPALGKSTLVRRMVTGLAGFGVMPLVLGDLKPDYVRLIRALGGQVVQLGHGRGYLNVLDPGGAREAADRLIAADRQDLAEEVLGDAHSRRHAMVAALITILRREPPTDREESILDRALRVLDEQHEQRRHAPGADRGAPVLADLLKVVQAGPEQVRAVALDRGDDTRYKAITENLEASLISLVSGGRLGETFSRATSEPMRHDAPVVFDVSAIDDNESDLQAAALMACWSNGFGTVNVAHALADAGLEPARQYFVVLDELWRALRSGRGMVDRVDALTRLNRGKGVGQAMVSHTMSDLEALTSEEDKAKARGFVERAGMVICAGLPEGEMPKLTRVVALSQAEQDMLASWTSPPSWDQAQGREGAPPGRGKFLIKVGGKPGIPLQVQLTSIEVGEPGAHGVHDTNVRWREVSRRGAPQLPEQVAPQVPLVEAVDLETVVATLRQVVPDPLAGVDPSATPAAEPFVGFSVETEDDADAGADVGVDDGVDADADAAGEGGAVVYAPLPPQAAAWLSDPSSVLPTARRGHGS